MSAELRVPAATRSCPRCSHSMRRARSGSLRWVCPKCRYLSDADPYLASMSNGAPSLPGMPPVSRWVLSFDGIPPGPNSRMGLRQQMGSKAKWRTAASERARILGIPPMGRIKLSAVFYRRAIGVADADNDMARLKNCVDGIVLAGVIPKDTRAYVEWGDVTEEHGPSGFALIIERLD